MDGLNQKLTLAGKVSRAIPLYIGCSADLSKRAIANPDRAQIPLKNGRMVLISNFLSLWFFRKNNSYLQIGKGCFRRQGNTGTGVKGWDNVDPKL
jgi:hypothetical protein